MTPETRAFIRALGTELSPQLMQATKGYLAERFAGIDPAVVITRDHAYGPHERHRLDIFNTAACRKAPVLVFVHGGGFVMGDKRAPDAPFYDNIGAFAAQQGWVGVTLNYRLAPAHPWPAGSEDIAAAVRWLGGNIAAHGGDPGRIFVMGQSAGAVHVAGYVADPRLHGAREPGGSPDQGSGHRSGLAGALMISGIYDVARADANQFHLAYYGADHAAWPGCSTLDGLAASKLPLFFSVSEFDGADFQNQAALLVARWQQAGKGFPPLYRLAGHNHLSPAQSIGTPLGTLEPLIRDFVASADL